MNHEDERGLAALAIQEAAKRQDEDQSKAHRRVGAVVVKNGDVMGVAHRGHEAPVGGRVLRRLRRLRLEPRRWKARQRLAVAGLRLSVRPWDDSWTHQKPMTRPSRALIGSWYWVTFP